MKFNVFAWEEVPTNEEIKIRKGRLRLQCSGPCAVYVSEEGYEALAGFGAFFDLEFTETVTLRVVGDVRAFMHRAPQTSFKAVGEVFTNIDRMTHESGTVLEVRKALRELELQRRAAIRSIRVAQEAAKPPEPELEVIEPEPEPEPQRHPANKPIRAGQKAAKPPKPELKVTEPEPEPEPQPESEA